MIVRGVIAFRDETRGFGTTEYAAEKERELSEKPEERKSVAKATDHPTAFMPEIVPGTTARMSSFKAS